MQDRSKPRFYDPRRIYRYWIRPSLRLLLSPDNLKKTVKLYKRGLKHGRFLSTMRRSGTHYLYALLSATEEIQKSGETGYTYYEGGPGKHATWKFKTESRIPNNLMHLQREISAGELKNISDNFFVLSHYPSVRPEFLFHPQCMKPVILIRHPIDAARSTFQFHYEVNSIQSHRHCIRNWIPLISKFMNYWGHYIRYVDSNVLVIKYENLKNNPVLCIDKIRHHWNLDYGQHAMTRAVKVCNKEKMQSKISDKQKKGNKRVTVTRAC